MRTTFTVANIWGIPIRIHLNWLITAVLVTWSLSAGYFPLEYPGWAESTYWMIGGLTSFLFFASVLLHELGHARLAQLDGVPVQSITLFLFGGVAHIAHEPESPGSEFRIVAAGPATSLGLAGLFFILGKTGLLSPQLSAVAVYLTRINLILAVFNLIPGFPLDGGRLLRAFLWKISQDYLRSTRWATRAGMGIAGLFVIGGLVFIALGNWVGGLWIIFIGGYLGMVARSASQSVLEEAQNAVEGGYNQFGPMHDREILPSRPASQARNGPILALKILPLKIVSAQRISAPWAKRDDLHSRHNHYLRCTRENTSLSFIPIPVDKARDQ